MSSSSGIKPSRSLVEALAALEKMEVPEAKVSALRVTISECETELVPSGSETAEPSLVCEKLEAKSCAFIVVKYEGGGILFVTHIPEGATVRQRMLYASTRSVLKETLGPGKIERTVRTDFGELEAEVGRGLLEDEEDAAPLTEEEARLQRKNQVSHRVQNASYFEDRRSGASKSLLSLDDDVLRSARSLLSSQEDSLMLCVATRDEKLVVLSTTKVGETLLAGFPTSGFLITKRKEHSEDGSPPLLLFLLCTEGAPTRERMVFACSTQTLQDALRSAGLPFESIAVSSASEVATFCGQSGAAHRAEGKAFSRPKRPGRGKRRLLGRTGSKEGEGGDTLSLRQAM